MRRRSSWFRWVRQLLLGVGDTTPSAAASTLSANDFDIDVSSAESAVLSGLVTNSVGTPLRGVQSVLTTYIERVSVSLSFGSADVAEIETTTGTAVITFFVRDRNDDPLVGIPAANLVLSSSGSNNTITALDTHSNNVGRMRWTLSSTTAQAKTLTLTALGLVITDTVPVTVTSPVSGLLWFTQWEVVGPGFADANFLDGGAFDSLGGSPATGTDAEIVAPTGLGLATRGNLLKIYNSGTNSLVMIKEEMVPAATTHWGSVYFKDPRTAGNHQHPICIGGLGGVPISINLLGLAAASDGTTYSAKTLFQTNGTTTPPYPHEVWRPGTQGVAGVNKLTSNVWYLLEWKITYLTATRLKLDIWLSLVDGNGNITSQDVYSTATIMRSDYAGEANGNLDYIGDNTAAYFGVSNFDADAGRKYVIGNEGPAVGADADGQYFFIASPAISLSGRIGDGVRS